MHLLLLLPTLLIATPTLVFHGLGDSCLNPGMKAFTKHLNKELDTPAHCIESGSFLISMFFRSFEQQSKKACEKVQKDFKGQDVNVVGLS